MMAITTSNSMSVKPRSIVFSLVSLICVSDYHVRLPSDRLLARRASKGLLVPNRWARSG